METSETTDIIFGVHHGVKHSDVFGKREEVDGTIVRVNYGMVVAQGEPYKTVWCPIFRDAIPYKSVTVVCAPEQLPGVLQHLMNAHGGSHSNEKAMSDGRIAIRSDYQAW